MRPVDCTHFVIIAYQHMSAFPQEQPIALVQYDEPLVLRLVEKVTIYEDKFTVEFKSGLTVDVDE